MSQKSTRRTRRQTLEDEEGVVKATTPKVDEETPLPPPGIPEPDPQEDTPPDVVPSALEEPPVITNGEESGDSKETETEQNGTNKTSRPATPENKVNGLEEAEEVKESPDVEMDPLVISDDLDPELVFEENSDLESGQSSPILSRCKTRRSLSRNVPTPKTPKSILEKVEEEEPPVPEELEPEAEQDHDEDLNNTFESCSDNISTKAEAGGDSTRMELSNLDSNSFLQGAKNKSFGETLRHLSTRRTIRPITDYRRKLLQSNVRNDVQSNNYPTRYSVERVSSIGLKRKNDGDEDDGAKRYKTDSPGFFSRFTSPLANIRNTFKGDMASSTPKLMGYKDDKCMLEEDGFNSQMYEVNDGQKRWCLIM